MSKTQRKTHSKSQSRARTKRTLKDQDLIVVDEGQGLIFESEEDLFGYFEKAIDQLEMEYQGYRSDEDFADDEQLKLEDHLEPTLDEPDEVWRDESSFPEFVIHYYLKTFEEEAMSYLAATYVSSEEQVPSFVLTHFPTRDPDLFKKYQRHDLIYDRRYEAVQEAALEGDALEEGDPLAMGLYLSMMKLRSEKDLAQNEFKNFGSLREETIESADEIWRKNDLNGHVLVTFIKEYPDHETKDLYYVAITQEDPDSNVHALLFSFPTTDESLVDRYRQGENLQAEEITQESSH